jgi:hypothetical protein
MADDPPNDAALAIRDNPVPVAIATVRAFGSFLGWLVGLSRRPTEKCRIPGILPSNSAGVLYLSLNDEILEAWLALADRETQAPELSEAEWQTQLRWTTRLMRWQTPGWLAISMDPTGVRVSVQGARMQWASGLPAVLDNLVADQHVAFEAGVLSFSKSPVTGAVGLSADALPEADQTFRGEYEWAPWIPDVVPPPTDPNELDLGLVVRATTHGSINHQMVIGSAEVVFVDADHATRVRYTLEHAGDFLDVKVKQDGDKLDVVFASQLDSPELKALIKAASAPTAAPG